MTFITGCSCPSKVLIHSPDDTFQSFTVLSPLADAMTYSTGEKLISQTPLLCPFKVFNNASVLASNTLGFNKLLWESYLYESIL